MEQAPSRHPSYRRRVLRTRPRPHNRLHRRHRFPHRVRLPRRPAQGEQEDVQEEGGADEYRVRELGGRGVQHGGLGRGAGGFRAGELGL